MYAMGRRIPSLIPLRLQSYDKICNQPNFFAFFLTLAPLFSEKELHTPAQACKMSPHSRGRESALTRPRLRTRRAETPHSQGRESALAKSQANSHVPSYHFFHKQTKTSTITCRPLYKQNTPKNPHLPPPTKNYAKRFGSKDRKMYLCTPINH